MTNHDLSHPVFQTVEEYDQLKSRLWLLEQELNRQCIAYAKSRGRAFMFPHHIRTIARVAKRGKEGADQ